MKIIGKDSVSNYIKIMLQMVFLLGIVVVITLPISILFYMQYLGLDVDNLYWFYLPILFASGTIALVLIYQFIQLFVSLKDETPFIMKNVDYLKRASICAVAISAIYFIGIFVLQSIFAGIIAAVFLVAWIGLYILSELFKQAVMFKEENELTI